MPFISKPSFVAWAFVVALAICRTALGEGDLDYTFKNGGYTYAPLPYTASTYSSCTASDAAIQADGKLLIAGVCDIRTDTVNSVGLVAVMRINRDGTLDTIESLRWRAAREGDPVAQAQMADVFDKTKKPAIAASLRACATEQNPDLTH